MHRENAEYSLEKELADLVERRQSEGLILVDERLRPKADKLSPEEIRAGYDYVLEKAQALCFEGPHDTALPMGKRGSAMLSPSVIYLGPIGEVRLRLRLLTESRYGGSVSADAIQTVQVVHVEERQVEGGVYEALTPLGTFRPDGVAFHARQSSNTRQDFDAVVEAVRFIDRQRHLA